MLKSVIAVFLCFSVLIITFSLNVCGNQDKTKQYKNDFSNLYELIPGMQTRSASSYDLTGGNADGFSLSGEVSKEESVLLEAEGPGVVNRIFIAGYAEHMQSSILSIYIDGQETPEVSLSYNEFFSGNKAPLLSPWVGSGSKSGGGVYTHMPIYFQKSIKIVQTYASYYDIDYTLFPADYSVTSFKAADTPDLPEWYSVEVGDNPNLGQYESVKKTVSLKKNATIEVLGENGPGIIRGIIIDIPDFRSFTKEERGEIFKNLSLEVYYDGKKEPDIKGTLGMLLGMGEFDYYIVKGLSQGITADGTAYFYLPMPYEKSIDIRLNCTEYIPEAENVIVEIQKETLDENTDFSNIAYLKTQNNTYDTCKEGEPITILKSSGAGKIVGVIQSLKSPEGWGHLEGDEIAYINGSKSHAIHGTGTEDFYGGAWYYVGGTFSNEFSGCTVLKTEEDGSTKNNAYRFMSYCPIYFDNGIDMTIEHGGSNDSKGVYANVLTIYYHKENALCKEIASNVISDVVDGSGEERTVKIKLEGYYSTSESSERVTERLLDGTSEIKAELSGKSKGLMIRRLFKMDDTKQGAAVYVDGKFVGNWINTFNRGSEDFMRYDDYYIPESFVEGKETVSITFKTLEGYKFGETSYQIFSYEKSGDSETHVETADRKMSWMWLLFAIPLSALILVIYYIFKIKTKI